MNEDPIPTAGTAPVSDPNRHPRQGNQAAVGVGGGSSRMRKLRQALLDAVTPKDVRALSSQQQAEMRVDQAGLDRLTAKVIEAFDGELVREGETVLWPKGGPDVSR